VANKATPKNIVIIGGGISGVATSYFLARRGLASTLIDPIGIAPAASGKAGGFLALDWNDNSPTGQLTRTSFALHQELATNFGEQAIGYRRLTCKAVAVTGANALKQRKAAGVEWADLGVVGSQPMGDESTIAQVHPKLLCDALWAESVKVGSKHVSGRAEGLELDADGARIAGVKLGEGSIMPADAVLLAMGPWSPAWCGLPRAVGQKYHSVVMRPERTLTQCVFFQGEGDPEVYPRGDGTAYVTGFPDPPAVVAEAPGAVEVREDVVRRLATAMSRVSSELGVAPVELEQACHLPLVSDGLPCLGAVPGVDGAFVATGAGCWGILLGPATGLAMSELMLDGKASSVDLTPFDPARFA
jgi:glycine/D-amino acid oxidase-like deaminating enzyme